MDRVSIIIPVYNQEKWVSEAVESALSQTHENIEVIVVNDGSTDNSNVEILKYKNRIKYIKQENKGLSIARNTGIKRASGNFVVPLDADDKIDTLFVEKLLPFMGKYDFVSTWIREFGDVNQIGRWGPYNGERHFKGEVSLCYCALYSKGMWAKIGGYKVIKTRGGAQGFEDYEFWLSAWELGFKGYVLPEPLFFYRKHGRSMINEAGASKRELNEIVKSLHRDLYKKYETNFPD